MKKKILVFIVTYKASFRLLNLINKIPFRYLSNYDYEIFISDDHSNDKVSLKYIDFIKDTFDQKIKINFNKKNIGYGANIKKCITYAYKKKYDYAVMLHGDNQYNPKYIVKMFKHALKYNCDAVVGSRIKKKGYALKGNMPIYKYLGNIVLSKYFNFFFKSQFSDCHTGYWLYNLKSIPKFYFYNCDDKFCFDIDLRLQLINGKKDIQEIAISTFYGTERSSFHIIYAMRFFYKVLKFKFTKRL
ncbi:glycosyltransferase family 2 protein [Candidatus Pelagibacter sp.]|nr:glycosyltransferase family 2 protein [Candidatus Pelagibacter sp.]